MVWICKNCETKNEGHQNACYICGALRHETKAVGLDKPDAPYGSDQNQPEDGKKPWLRSPVVITLLALMMFGLLFVGIWFVGRPLDGAGAETLMKPGDTQEQRNSEQGEIMWHDAFLEDGIRKALGKGEGESVTLADTAGIYALSIVGDSFIINDTEFGAKVVFDFDGVYLPGSETAVEIPERIVSLEDMTQFPNLTTLTFVASEFSSIEGLESCDRLVELILDGNGIEDVSSIASLHNLQRLHLGGNLDDSDLQIIGLLTKLEYLSIPDCNNVKSIAPLESLKKLQVLNLSWTSVVDIRAIANMTQLRELDLEGVEATDFSALSGLSNLEKLNLGGTDIIYLTPLNDMIQLRFLNLNCCSIRDLSPLRNLTNLEALDLSGSCYVTDIRALSGMIKLRDLNLDGLPITEIKALSNLSDLERLNIMGTSVSNLTPLKNLTKLKKLFIGETKVKDLSPLKNLINIENLILYYDDVSNLSPLSNMKKLEQLQIQCTNVTDVSPLKGLPLKYVCADENLEQELREMFPYANIN